VSQPPSSFVGSLGEVAEPAVRKSSDKLGFASVVTGRSKKVVYRACIASVTSRSTGRGRATSAESLDPSDDVSRLGEIDPERRS
jgi:hypothetical protein